MANNVDGVLRVTARALDPVDTAITSASTPSNCTRISSADWKRSSGRGEVARSSHRYSESCSANSGTASGPGSESTHWLW